MRKNRMHRSVRDYTIWPTKSGRYMCVRGVSQVGGGVSGGGGNGGPEKVTDFGYICSSLLCHSRFCLSRLWQSDVIFHTVR